MTHITIPDFTPSQFVNLFLFGEHAEERLMAWNELQNLMSLEDISKLINSQLSK